MSDEKKWTPGPWQVKRSGCISNRDGELIATTGYRVAVVDGVAGEEDDANARLIAAAPEMYEALRDMLADFADRHASGCNLNPCVCAVGRARAALAKADGK